LTDALKVAEQAVESFDLGSFVSETASAPEDSVVIYLDGETAYQIEQVKRQHDEWVREKAYRAEQAKDEPRGIADEDEDDPEELVNIEETLERLQEHVRKTGLRVYMRGVGEVERDLIGHKIVRSLPFGKNATDEEKAIRAEERKALTIETWLAKAITKIERVSDGAVSPAPSVEGVTALHAALYESEWDKLVALFNDLSFANALFDRAVDAGFPGGGTLEA